MADSGDTAWMLVATGFVLLMTPGLAFFEAGLLRSRNSISILMQCWGGLCILSTLWYVVGFSLCFGEDGAGLIGNPIDYLFMQDVAITYDAAVPGANTTADSYTLSDTIPMTVFASFQMMFAVITPLLITGAFSERVPFGAFVWFIVLWSVFVYYPACHWVWGGGWLSDIGDCACVEGSEDSGGCVKEDADCVDRGGAIDFAGGIVIHTTAGMSSLIVALVLGPRTGFKGDQMMWQAESRPHSIPLAMIGAAMLWMGWFGFNAGSAVASGHSAGHTLLNTHIAASTCALVWIALSNFEDGKPSIVAALNGAVAGLAGVTPASGFIHSQAAAVLGLVLGFASYYGVKLIKGKFGVDDALDVSSVHGITGIVGSLAVGFVAHADVTCGCASQPRGAAQEACEDACTQHGLFFGGGGHLLLWQVIAVVVCGAWASVCTYLICKALELALPGGFRVSAEMEEEGLDQGLHGETARVLDLSPNAMSPKHAAAVGIAKDMEELSLASKPAAAQA